MAKDKIRIGTRKSKLALIQAEMVAELLRKEVKDIQIIPIVTTGDRLQEKNISEEGGKVLFIKELEEALFKNDIDIAVHSYKDMPAKLPEGLVIKAVLPREDARDALVSKSYKSFIDLPENAIIGSSSVRRQAIALNIRPDLKFVPFRGNVNTRLEKIEQGEVVATILATAGVKRLNMLNDMISPISLELMLPAPTQGIIAIEARVNDIEIHELLEKITHTPTEIVAKAERAFMEVVEGSCKQPLAAYAVIDSGQLIFEALLATPDGKKIEKIRKTGIPEEAENIGREAGTELKKRFGL